MSVQLASKYAFVDTSGDVRVIVKTQSDEGFELHTGVEGHPLSVIQDVQFWDGLVARGADPEIHRTPTHLVEYPGAGFSGLEIAALWIDLATGVATELTQLFMNSQFRYRVDSAEAITLWVTDEQFDRKNSKTRQAIDLQPSFLLGGKTSTEQAVCIIEADSDSEFNYEVYVTLQGNREHGQVLTWASIGDITDQSTTPVFFVENDDIPGGSSIETGDGNWDTLNPENYWFFESEVFVIYRTVKMLIMVRKLEG
jgi:hypothetical protein